MAKPKIPIEKHPDKKKIDAALVKQVPYETVAAQYGLSKSAIGRYVKTRLSQRIAKAIIETDEEDQQWVVKKLRERLEDSENYHAAVCEELKDPTNKAKYYVGPRAHDVQVAYKTKTGRWRKASLQTLLDRINKSDMTISDTETRFTDPRMLHIRSSEALVKEITAIAKMLGHVKDITINVTQTEEWHIIKQVIIESTAEHPEIRGKIVDGLKRAGDRS